MAWGPFRGISIGGIVFGAALLVVGVLFLLISQKIIAFEINLLAVCSVGLIIAGVVAVGGALWARRMMRGRWQKWMMGGEDKEM